MTTLLFKFPFLQSECVNTIYRLTLLVKDGQCPEHTRGFHGHCPNSAEPGLPARTALDWSVFHQVAYCKTSSVAFRNIDRTKNESFYTDNGRSISLVNTKFLSVRCYNLFCITQSDLVVVWVIRSCRAFSGYPLCFRGHCIADVNVSAHCNLLTVFLWFHLTCLIRVSWLGGCRPDRRDWK